MAFQIMSVVYLFGGINRYNRSTNSFERYRLFNPHNKSYTGNVWSLLADTKQRLWACAVRGGGLYKFNNNSRQFDAFDALQKLQAIAEDKEGNLWAGDYAALIRIDTVHGKHQFYTIGYPVRCIYEDEKNNFWVGTQEGGLMLFDCAKRFEHY